MVDNETAQSLKTVGWVSYLLHLIVAVAAVIPGAQVGAGLLVVALVIDLVKKSDAEGTWQESHFSWRIRTVMWAGVLYLRDLAVVVSVLVARHGSPGPSSPSGSFTASSRAWSHEREPGHARPEGSAGYPTT